MTRKNGLGMMIKKQAREGMRLGRQNKFSTFKYSLILGEKCGMIC